ncbi:MAG: hypothetical protein ACJAT4_002434 [Granulosicoccus sp.]|jgi:hypothetical protein
MIFSIKIYISLFLNDALVVSQVVSDRLNIENTRESTHQLLFDLPLRLGA